MTLLSLRVHHSQFPDQVRSELVESLRARQVNHKFHYDSIKQAQKWLRLHEQYSPARTDPLCKETYDKSFQFACENIGSDAVHLIGLGCGGGQKEAQLLTLLQTCGSRIHFTASDVSSALVITSYQRASKIIGDERCDTLVCDLASVADLGRIMDEISVPGARRIITFFGLIPNFEPAAILQKLSAMLRPNDLLLFSANLAPGPDYQAGVEKVFPLYRNELTRDWLMTFLSDLGVEESDGEMIFGIEEVAGLKRITATFEFSRSREVWVDAERFSFDPGHSIRLFFSYRHTPETIRSLLAGQGIGIVQQWIVPSGEEGVFACRKT